MKNRTIRVNGLVRSETKQKIQQISVAIRGEDVLRSIVLILALLSSELLFAEPLILSTPGQTYTLQGDLSFDGNGIYVAAPDVTIDLNGKTLSYGSDGADHRHGVLLYISWFNTEITIPNAKTPERCRIINGKIQHAGNGKSSHAIYSRRSYGAMVESVHVDVNGEDSCTVKYLTGNRDIVGNVIPTIRDCHLVARAISTANRHAGPANVEAAGEILIERSVLLGGNSATHIGSNSVVRKSILSHSGFDTNGYGVFLYRKNDVTVEDNIIVPTQGRGVILNAGSRNLVRRNVILHLEQPNAEFGDNLNPPAIRRDTNSMTTS